MASFSSLPRKAQRAAFAKMDAAKKAKAKPSRGSARKRMTEPKTSQVVSRQPDGGIKVTGRITREQAAALMFGTKGAAARIAKARRKKK